MSSLKIRSVHSNNKTRRKIDNKEILSTFKPLFKDQLSNGAGYRPIGSSLSGIFKSLRTWTFGKPTKTSPKDPDGRL